jgi:hypothetical protein
MSRLEQPSSDIQMKRLIKHKYTGKAIDFVTLYYTVNLTLNTTVHTVALLLVLVLPHTIYFGVLFPVLIRENYTDKIYVNFYCMCLPVHFTITNLRFQQIHIIY